MAEAHRTEDGLQNPAARLARPRGQAAAAIRRVGEDHLQASEVFVQFGQQPACPVLILNRGRMHHEAQHQAQRVHGQMSLAARASFCGIVAPLIAGDEMGQLFKACCLSSPGWTTPAFEETAP